MLTISARRKRRCGRGARGRKEGVVFWTRDNGFRRDALESQQTAADHGARLRGDDRRCGAICGKTCRCVHRGEIIGRLNMRGGSRTERCAGAIGARRGSDPLRTASGDAAAVENRQALGDAAAFLIGTVRSLAIYRARRQREYLGRGGGLTGGTARESAAPDRRSGPSGAKDAARLNKALYNR